MSKIILTVTGWFIQKLGLLLLVILALLLAPSVKNAWLIVEDFQSDIVIRDIVTQLEGSFPDKNSKVQETKDTLNSLRINCDQKKMERIQLKQVSCILPTCTLIKESRIYRADAEIEILTQALIIGEAIVRGAQTCQELKLYQPHVEQLRQTVHDLNQVKSWFMLTNPFHKRLIDDLEQAEAKQTELFNSCERYRTGH